MRAIVLIADAFGWYAGALLCRPSRCWHSRSQGAASATYHGLHWAHHDPGHCRVSKTRMPMLVWQIAAPLLPNFLAVQVMWPPRLTLGSCRLLRPWLPLRYRHHSRHLLNIDPGVCRCSMTPLCQGRGPLHSHEYTCTGAVAAASSRRNWIDSWL